MPQSYTCLHYHLIFSTKNRQPLLSDALRPRLYEYIGGILRLDHGKLVAAGGTADHIHLLTAISREQSIAAALRTIKTNSSKWVHETIPGLGTFAWQSGYGAFTIGYSGLENVRCYIERQEEHHRTMTFQEEFRSFLDRYEIPYDEKYLWR